MSHNREHAVILAAGRGERLKAYTNYAPKSLVHVAGVPLINRIMESLHKSAGVRRFFVATGYRAKHLSLLEPPKDCEVHLVENKKWEQSHSMLSLALCMDYLNNGGFVVQANCCFDEKIIDCINDDRGVSRWLVQPFALEDMGECLRANESGVIRRLSVEKPGSRFVHQSTVRLKELKRKKKFEREEKFETAWKSCGVMHLIAETAWDLERWLKDAIRERRENEPFERIICENLEAAQMHIADIGKARFQRIESEEDLKRAEDIFG